MSAAHKRLYVVSATHNRRATVTQFAQQLKRQTFQEFVLVLVDDGSTDGAADAVRSILPDTVVLRGSGELWWAGSLQLAWNWLRKECAHPMSRDQAVLIINDDVVMGDDYLEVGYRKLMTTERTLVLSQLHAVGDGRILDRGVHWDWPKFEFRLARTPEEVNCLSTRGLFLRAADFLALGGFYPRLLPHYLSDYEFTIRAHSRGYSLLCAPDVRLGTDPRESGLPEPDHPAGTRQVLRIIFSKRYHGNPFYRSVFLLLAAPFPHNVRHIWPQWRPPLKLVYRNLPPLPRASVRLLVVPLSQSLRTLLRQLIHAAHAFAAFLRLLIGAAPHAAHVFLTEVRNTWKIYRASHRAERDRQSRKLGDRPGTTRPR